MKHNPFILFGFLLTTLLSLNACVKNQNVNSAYATNAANVDNTVDYSSVGYQDQNINTTNYMQTLRNQSVRAQAAGLGHGGGGRR